MPPRSNESLAAPEAERPLDDAAPVPGLLNPSSLSESRVSSRQLCDFLWAQRSLRISPSAGPLGRAKMLEGFLPGAGLPFAAVPSVSAFTFLHATFKHLLQNYLGALLGTPCPTLTIVAVARCNSLTGTTVTTSKSVRCSVVVRGPTMSLRTV